MNVYEKYDEIPSMTLKDINETKCYRHGKIIMNDSDDLLTFWAIKVNDICTSAKKWEVLSVSP